MRNAQQLIDAANRSGTYEGFQGDGATVPWDLVLPPHDMLLYVYKLYLDARWPEAFRLHDWCYTALGGLIAVTREEADHALLEIIGRDSPSDALLVYTACRLGGGPFFGTSLTGRSGRNMPAANPGGSRMAIKVVIIMKAVMGDDADPATRVAGFSESVWYNSDDVAACINTLKNGTVGGALGLLPSRAALLPSSASITGVKLYAGGAGKGQAFALPYPGNSGAATDIPQMALWATTFSNTTGRKRGWWVHCVPDVYVVKGLFVPSGAYTTKLNNYFRSLEPFSFLTRPSNPTLATIFTITQVAATPPATAATGVVTVSAIGTIAANDRVTLQGIKDDQGDLHTVTMQVQAINGGTNQLIIANWTLGNCTGGTVQNTTRDSSSFVFDNTNATRIGTRKVGRPFDLYRGRRSKRRVRA